MFRIKKTDKEFSSINEINEIIKGEKNVEFLYNSIKMVKENIKFNYIIEEFSDREPTSFFILTDTAVLHIININQGIEIKDTIFFDNKLREEIKTLLIDGRYNRGIKKVKVNTKNYIYKLYEVDAKNIFSANFEF